ncbi:hypothetical protein K466DRAFT_370616 [Polyporus arcularius HHB13444]|uniref:Uncharacterized protein n=1 Tax=Polyporus arcularius HHB13444 TaxID=1314778 RepID=A0A5C3PX79_9APHY|nr:hypothetical protein K466DRAFT_370616 [Polyporus arcularius HHB13444]
MPNEAREMQQHPAGHETLRQCVPSELGTAALWGRVRGRGIRHGPFYHQRHCIQWAGVDPSEETAHFRRVYVMCPSRVGVGVGVRDAGQREHARARRSDSAELLGCECVRRSPVGLDVRRSALVSATRASALESHPVPLLVGLRQCQCTRGRPPV